MPDTLFDAISTALETNGADTGASDVDHDGSQDTSEGADDSAADDSSLDAGDDQNADGSADGDGEEGEQGGDETEGDGSEGEGDEGAGAQRDPATGKFVKKGDEKPGDKPGEKPGEKPGDKPGDKKGAKEPDPINDPIPQDLKKETQQRIRTLIDRTKQSEERATTVQRDFDYMVNGLKATGTTPEQYGEVLSFMALFNSGDPTQQGKALELLEGMADRLATSLGRERTVGDPLASHDDLRAEVQQGKLSVARAKEIARARNQGAFQTQMRDAATAQERQSQQAQQELNQARSDLNQLEDSLKASDPHYAAKKAAILPALQVLFPSIPPSQWKAKFQEAYRRVAAPRATPRPQPRPQPLRGGGGAGGGSGKNSGEMAAGGPGTMFDAVSAALANMPK